MNSLESTGERDNVKVCKCGGSIQCCNRQPKRIGAGDSRDMRYRHSTRYQSAKEGDTEEMNEEIMRKAGFGKEMDAVKEGKCAMCDNKIDPKTEFRDELSMREYSISGLCQKCQERVFGK